MEFLKTGWGWFANAVTAFGFGLPLFLGNSYDPNSPFLGTIRNFWKPVLDNPGGAVTGLFKFIWNGAIKPVFSGIGSLFKGGSSAPVTAPPVSTEPLLTTQTPPVETFRQDFKVASPTIIIEPETPAAPAVKPAEMTKETSPADSFNEELKPDAGKLKTDPNSKEPLVEGRVAPKPRAAVETRSETEVASISSSPEFGKVAPGTKVKPVAELAALEHPEAEDRLEWHIA